MKLKIVMTLIEYGDGKRTGKGADCRNEFSNTLWQVEKEKAENYLVVSDIF